MVMPREGEPAMLEYDRSKLLNPDIYYRIRHSGRGPVRIVEYCGPLGAGGMHMYRVQVRPKPHAAYSVACEDQLEPIPPGEENKPIVREYLSKEQSETRAALTACLRSMTDANFDPRKVLEAVSDGVNGVVGIPYVEAIRLLAVACRVLLVDENGPSCPACRTPLDGNTAPDPSENSLPGQVDPATSS
jgi:hypothetical protein